MEPEMFGTIVLAVNGASGDEVRELTHNTRVNPAVASVTPLAGCCFRLTGRCERQAARRPAAVAADAPAGYAQRWADET